MENRLPKYPQNNNKKNREQNIAFTLLPHLFHDFFHKTRKNPSDPRTSIPVHERLAIIPYGIHVLKGAVEDAEVLAVEALDAEVKIEVGVEVELAVVGVAVDKVGSAVYVADKPVAFLQDEGSD